MSLTGQREDTTLNLDKDVSDLLGLLAEEEDRTKKAEVAFLVKERARKLGVKA